MLDRGVSYQVFYSKGNIQVFLKNGCSHFLCNIIKNWNCS
jgi:hypothetical protein